MTEPFRSAVHLRHNLCVTTAELQRYGTAILPDGATVYVSGSDRVYRLWKNLGSGYDIAHDLVIVPADQTSNRWVLETINGAPAWQATMVLNTPNTVTPPAQTQWQALGSTPGSFILSDGDPDAFSLNPTSGLITYKGITRKVTLAYQLSISGSAGSNVIPYAAISVSNDIAVGSTGSNNEKGAQTASFSNGTNCCIAGQRTVTLSLNDTIRLMLRNLSGTEALPVVNAMLSIKP